MPTSRLSDLQNRGYFSFMPIAITDDHRTLAETVSDFLTKRQSRAAGRSLLGLPDPPIR
jgi:hypothetical protein